MRPSLSAYANGKRTFATSNAGATKVGVKAECELWIGGLKGEIMMMHDVALLSIQWLKT